MYLFKYSFHSIFSLDLLIMRVSLLQQLQMIDIFTGIVSGVNPDLFSFEGGGMTNVEGWNFLVFFLHNKRTLTYKMKYVYKLYKNFLFFYSSVLPWFILFSFISKFKRRKGLGGGYLTTPSSGSASK